MNSPQKALDELLAWTGSSEIDLYPYFREVFTNIFGYPKDHIRLAERGSHGKIPDLSLCSIDVKPKASNYWIVGEIKKERRCFRSAVYRNKEWEDQLKNYVTADTIYALLLDPETVVILRPNGKEVKIVELNAHSADALLSQSSNCSLAFLHYNDSICEKSLTSFKEGKSPTRYINVETAKVNSMKHCESRQVN